MNQLLSNPVYHALLSGDKHLCFGNGQVKYFDEEVSPFVGFDNGNEKGFADLYEQLPAGRNILHATPFPFTQPPGWILENEINGLQFVYENGYANSTDFSDLVPLQDIHIEQMIQLAKLTKPGPFGSRTIDFGNYFGIFEKDNLVAMTGQRLHVNNYTEISAVCTHPDHTGKGYAYKLLQHQLQLIWQQDQIPFLHVRDNNHRAIALYERMGFTVSGQMNFYFMKRE